MGSDADIQSCLERDFFTYYAGMKTAQADAPDLLGRMKGALLRMLAETDDLPRDHLIWRYLAVQTVNRTRLGRYTHLKLQGNPLDKDALWASIASALISGIVSHEQWQNLRRAEERFDVDWLIYASLRASLDGHDEDNEDLTSFLTRNDLSESAVPILKSLEAGEHDYVRLVLDPIDLLYDSDRVIDWARHVSTSLRQSASLETGPNIMPKIHINPPGLFPSQQYGFSQIVVAQGHKTVYLSGQVGCDEQLRMVDLHDLGAQARKALENLDTAMQVAGGTRDDVVSLRIYIVGEHMKNTAAITEALTGFFHPERLPATSWIGVASLARPEFLIEIEAIAVLD